jgi:hypothetical protein
MDVSISVLGYWWWWLFVVASLRTRLTKVAGKKALDIAFLASPAIGLIVTVVFTKDTGLIGRPTLSLRVDRTVMPLHWITVMKAMMATAMSVRNKRRGSSLSSSHLISVTG